MVIGFEKYRYIIKPLNNLTIYLENLIAISSFDLIVSLTLSFIQKYQDCQEKESILLL